MNAGELVERLTGILEHSDADVAVASPLKKGGRLFDLWWWSRTVTVWTNRFLSLAAHGELLAIAGIVRVFRRGVLERALQSCPGRDIDSEALLECRRQGARIVEVPAILLCDTDAGQTWWPAMRALSLRVWHCVRTALHYRPALWLAVPGLLPGLLPLVAAILWILKTSAPIAAAAITVTIIIQYASLGIFSWQTTGFIARLLKARVAP